jgi:phage terminase large subunit-like protein
VTALSKQIAEARQARRGNKLATWRPYPKQADFLRLGATCDERMLRAGNQLGKTEVAAYELALHLTGRYPVDWEGRRFNRPIRAWCAGESTVATRDIMQSKLCGRPGVVDEFGTGFIPRELLVDKTLSHGSADAFDTVQIKHVSGGVSTLTFKSFEQGRSKYQGESLDVVWLDEEPPMDIYSECRTRLAATKGVSFVTYTPLKGRTDLVNRFDREASPSRGLVIMAIHDAPHMGSPEEIARQIASYPPHEREARAYGTPMQRSGRVFLTPEDEIRFDAASLPAPVLINSAKVIGLDFGISHAFAAVLIAWDRDVDVIYVLDAVKMTGLTKLQHVPAVRRMSSRAPVAWPHDGHARDRGSGDELAEQYRNPMPGMPGLKMLPEHATFEDGGYSFEAGLAELVNRFETGRLKIAAHLTELFDEYRDLHRDNGLVVKVRDDLLSALRIAVMSRRFAEVVRLGDLPERSRDNWKVHHDNSGSDFDLFTGRPFENDRQQTREWVGPTPPRPDWL